MLWCSALIVPVASAEHVAQGEVFTTDFSEYPAGEGVPDGWSEQWARSHYEIADSPSRLVTTSYSSTSGGGRHALTWDNVGEVRGDVEVATLVRAPFHTLPGGTNTRFQVHLLAGGEPDAIDGYLVDYTGSERQGVRIRRSIDGAQSTVATAAEELSMHVWHHVVFQRAGDMLRVKIWPYFEDEPDEWLIESEDDSHDSGRVGIGYFTAIATQEYAWLSVGTGGQPAERAPEGIDGIPEPRVPGTVSPTGAAERGAVRLDWEPIVGADHYEIERDGELIAHGWENSAYADPTLPPGTTGAYRVRGVSVLAGAGAWSAPVEVAADPLPDELSLRFEVEPNWPWTTHEEELDFLDELAARSPRVAYKRIGRSGEGRPLHLVRIGRDGPPDNDEIANRPTILVAGGNHGNEPAGRQGVLLLMRELATSNDPQVVDWLDQYAVLIVPTINPDGRVANTRNLVDPDIDGNRDYIALTASETRAVTRVLRDHRPEVVIDAHEWGASAGEQRGELEMSPPGNANAHPEVLALSAELAFERIMAKSNHEVGWRSVPYQEVYGQPTRLRQVGAIKHALTYLIESSRAPEIRRLDEADLDRDDPGTRMRRVTSQRFALSEAFQFLTENVDAVRKATVDSVAAAEANASPLYTSGSVVDPPGPADTLDPPPCGWAVQADDEEAVKRVLAGHGVEWQTRRLPGGQRIMFVPAAQRARPLALITVDAASPDRLDGVSSIRFEDSGWCRRGR